MRIAERLGPGVSPIIVRRVQQTVRRRRNRLRNAVTLVGGPPVGFALNRANGPRENGARRDAQSSRSCARRLG